MSPSPALSALWPAATTTPGLGAAFATGLASCAALILAIGAQNAFVLRQGLRRERVALVVLICALSDAVLIQAGVWGLGGLLLAWPAVDPLMRGAGGLFLLVYAWRAAARARQPAAQALHASAGSAAPASRAGIALTTLALTWLNPHVYLDTVLLLGSVAAPFGGWDRAAFAAGATLASVLWFSALGFGAGVLAPWFARPRAWQWLDAGVALLMLVLAIALLAPLVSARQP